jgi:hypothetical protein
MQAETLAGFEPAPFTEVKFLPNELRSNPVLRHH